MPTLPLVSVIVPAFNAEAFIGEALNSIFVQTYTPIEVIVIDDGSTDRTSEIVRQSPRSVVFCRKPSSTGAAAARNMAFELCTGEYICFVDADDLLVPDRIARHVEFMERNSSVDVSFCDYRNFSQTAQFSTTHFETCSLLRSKLGGAPELILDNPCEHLARENFGSAGSLFFRRRVMRLEPPFDVSLRGGEDFHYYYRLCRHSSAGVVNHVGFLRRLHDSNATRDSLMMLNSGIRSRSLLRDTEANSELRRLLGLHVAGCQADLSRLHASQGRFLDACQMEWAALWSRPGPPEVVRAARGFARIALMGLGLMSRRM
jgi:glycosyltransferase involved in cell wall biosynthesis